MAASSSSSSSGSSNLGKHSGSLDLEDDVNGDANKEQKVEEKPKDIVHVPTVYLPGPDTHMSYLIKATGVFRRLAIRLTIRCPAEDLTWRTRHDTKVNCRDFDGEPVTWHFEVYGNQGHRLVTRFRPYNEDTVSRGYYGDTTVLSITDDTVIDLEVWEERIVDFRALFETVKCPPFPLLAQARFVADPEADEKGPVVNAQIQSFLAHEFRLAPAMMGMIAEQLRKDPKFVDVDVCAGTVLVSAAQALTNLCRIDTEAYGVQEFEDREYAPTSPSYSPRSPSYEMDSPESPVKSDKEEKKTKLVYIGYKGEDSRLYRLMGLDPSQVTLDHVKEFVRLCDKWLLITDEEVGKSLSAPSHGALFHLAMRIVFHHIRHVHIWKSTAEFYAFGTWLCTLNPLNSGLEQLAVLMKDK